MKKVIATILFIPFCLNPLLAETNLSEFKFPSEVSAAYGEPNEKINKEIIKTEIWLYDDKKVIIKNKKVFAINLYSRVNEPIVISENKKIKKTEVNNKETVKVFNEIMTELKDKSLESEKKSSKKNPKRKSLRR